MKSIAGYVFLLWTTVAAESVSFKITRNTCDHVYGTPLEVFNEPNFLQCARRCSHYDNNGTCNSLMYNTATKVCMLNQDVQSDHTNFPVDCGFQYAVRMIKYFGCRGEWTYADGRCYKYIDQYLSWASCKTECEIEGGLLARIYNASTYGIIFAVAENAWNNGAMTDWYYPWGGVHDMVTEGVYMDGQDVPYAQELYSTFYYNDGSQNCGSIGETRTYMDGCEYQYSCICEMEASSITNVVGI